MPVQKKNYISCKKINVSLKNNQFKLSYPDSREYWVQIIEVSYTLHHNTRTLVTVTGQKF